MPKRGQKIGSWNRIALLLLPDRPVKGPDSGEAYSPWFIILAGKMPWGAPKRALLHVKERDQMIYVRRRLPPRRRDELVGRCILKLARDIQNGVVRGRAADPPAPAKNVVAADRSEP